MATKISDLHIAREDLLPAPREVHRDKAPAAGPHVTREAPEHRDRPHDERQSDASQDSSGNQQHENPEDK